MIKLSEKEEKFLQRLQEARSFIGKNGPHYVQHFATEEEKKYFEGIIYYSGIPILSFLHI